MFKKSLLTEDERRVYDDLIYDAAIDPASGGKARPSHEFGGRLYAQLVNLAGHAWVDDLIQHAAEQGLQKIAKDWLKESQVIETRFGDRIAKKPAVVGTRKRLNADGAIGHQQTLWQELTLDELWQVATSADAQIDSMRITVATAKRLIALCNRHDADDVLTALDREGTTLDAFLAA